MRKINDEKSISQPRETKTERLRIRQFRTDDFEQYAEYHRNKEVYRYLYQDPPSDEELQMNFSNALKGQLSSDGDSLSLAVVRVSDETVTGEVILKMSNKAALQGEVGYIFNPRFAGNGYAAEAVSTMVDIGFDDIGFNRIFARLDPKNRGSVGVVERLQFRREAHLIQNDLFKGVWGDEYIYAILANEWRSRRN